jgi:pyruvate/2-oxoglutarate dehydrogenase complex dihydrolipoamide dehydrogenase (E3) component
MKTFDAIVIGTGQSGPSMAVALARSGKRVAVIEAKHFGGSCVNDGCRPTKTLIASARAVHLAGRGADFGFQTGSLEVNWSVVHRRVREIIERGTAGVEHWLRSTSGIEVFCAFGRFLGKHEGLYLVEAGAEQLAAAQVFINTGTRPLVPDVVGIETVPWLDSQRLLRLEQRPEHLIVLGGSYIGMEMGQAFRRLGSRVSIVHAPATLVNREDDDMKQELHRIFAREAIDVYTQSTIVKAEPCGSGIRVFVRHHDGSERILEGSHWLCAVGRVPNSDQLNLQAVGIETDARGFIGVNEFLETSASGVFALGDVNGKGAFTHTSYQDFEIVRDNLLFGRGRKWTDRITSYALFTDPPLGRVGMTETEARASGKQVLMAVKPMSKIGRAVEEAQTDGLIKLLVDAETHTFLGAAVLGIYGDEVIQSIAYFMATGSRYEVMQETLPIHPTVAEFLPTILGELRPL